MTVTSTIGTAGRNYTTIAAWIASIPATLADSYVGQCFNDAEFVSAGQVGLISGHTTTTSFTITLTTGTGQSFADNTNKLTNALTYNVANGAAIRSTGSYTSTIQVDDSNVIISKLQIKSTASTSEPLNVTGGAGNFLMDGCILDSAAGNTLNAVIGIEAHNTLVVCRGSGAAQIVQTEGGARLINCTLVVPNTLTAASAAFASNYSPAVTLVNCAIFGCLQVEVGSSLANYTTCMTNVTSPPSGCTTATYANQFVNAGNSASDFRSKTGANLIDVGTAATSYIPTAVDIVGTHRPQGTAWDIGVWEYSSGTIGSGAGTAAGTGAASAVGVGANNYGTANGVGAASAVGQNSTAIGTATGTGGAGAFGVPIVARTVDGDRVKETTTTTGTGVSIALNGALPGPFESFVTGVGAGNKTDYCVVSGDGYNWEVNNGVVISGTPNLITRRATPRSSSNMVGGVPQQISLVGTSLIFQTPSALSFVRQRVWPVTLTSNYTMVEDDTGIFFNNSGAAGTVKVTLIAPQRELRATFTVMTAQSFVIATPVGTFIQAGTMLTSSGGNLTSSTVGSSITLFAQDNTQWWAESLIGTWVAA